ncbi:alpha/beta family hydrolase [Chitinimonas sp.]|uniref:alpha/beta family hydrolase n=1 Tax=Chitinimonas sp. TaxID=1934313 RepID=UPI0035B304F4
MSRAPLLLASLIAAAPAVADTALAAAHGQSLPFVAQFPQGDGPFPAVLIAPGQKYPLDMPAIAEPAAQLLAHGFAVYRFNWRYFVADPLHGAPSADLATELDDMRSVLAAMRKDARVRADQLFVAGKSLGSVVAWRLLASDKAIKGGWLITPLCSFPASPHRPAFLADADAAYPGIESETRPIGFVAGDRDRLCDTRTLYAFAARAAAVRVDVISGDHSFKTGDDASARQATEQTIRLLGALGVDFFTQLIR